MERKVGLHQNRLLWAIFLTFSSSAPLNYGGVHKDLPSRAVKHRAPVKETILDTFEIDGHVIDCIDIYKQPSFAHPLLVNHTLQMEPTYYPKTSSDDHVMEVSELWNLSKSCPQGSIPIERAQGHFRNTSSVGQDSFVHEHSVVEVNARNFGAKATINVWNPKVENGNGSSVSQIWILSADGTTTVEAGWTDKVGGKGRVNSPLYGTDRTRFFTFWTSDSYNNGCYNLDCPGFVQTNQKTILSSYLNPVSVYGGQQYNIDVAIFQDKATGNWWLYLQGAAMGYWPKQLVPSMAGGAGTVEWGGEITYPKPAGGGRPHVSTQMGSGHYSSEGFHKASFFRDVRVLDGSNLYRTPRDFEVAMDNSNCYDLQVGRNKDGPWGLFFYYGGPGRSGKCT